VAGVVRLKMEKSGRVQIFGKNISLDGQAIKMRGGEIKKIAPDGPEKRAAKPRLRFFIPIDPDHPAEQEDAYDLLREDGSVHQRRKLEAVRRGERQRSALFTDLEWGRKYSLQVDKGREGKHFIFRQKPIEELVASHGDQAQGAGATSGDPAPAKRDEGH
jgi:hypothetical protein